MISSDPTAALPDLSTPAGVDPDTSAALAQALAASAGASPALFDPQPLELDMDAAPEPPDYFVDGLLVRGALAVLAGPPGGGKSFLVQDLIVATLQNRPWLGRKVRGTKVLVVDEENSKRLVRARLRALGLTTDRATEGLRYYCSAGFNLIEEEHVDRLAAVVAEHKPDLLVFDTLAAVSPVADMNDNTEAAIFGRVVRQRIAEPYGCVPLFLAHTRKETGGRPNGESLGGARQWSAIVASHLGMEPVTDPKGGEQSPDDGIARQCFVLSSHKLREDVPIRPELIALETLRDDGALLQAEIHSEGPYECVQRETKVGQALSLVLGVLEADSPRSRGELDKALDDVPSSTLDKALKQGLEDGALIRPDRGQYALATPAKTEPKI